MWRSLDLAVPYACSGVLLMLMLFCSQMGIEESEKGGFGEVWVGIFPDLFEGQEVGVAWSMAHTIHCACCMLLLRARRSYVSVAVHVLMCPCTLSASRCEGECYL